MTTDPAVNAPYVSTGNLPPAEHVRLLVNEAYERFRANAEGELSQVYPSLAAVDPDRFGICVANSRGLTADAGDADVEFTIMSVAKPFVFALMCGLHTPSTVAQFVGLNATGRRFNSVSAIEDRPDGKTNPMVNPGAMATTSMAPGGNTEEKWRFLQEGLSGFAGRDLSIDEETFASASATNAINRAIGDLLCSYGRLAAGSEETVDLYTRQSCLRVTARDLAVMAATLASGGVNPSTGEQVVDQVSCRCAMVVNRSYDVAPVHLHHQDQHACGDVLLRAVDVTLPRPATGSPRSAFRLSWRASSTPDASRREADGLLGHEANEATAGEKV